MLSIYEPPKKDDKEAFEEWCHEMFHRHRYSFDYIAAKARVTVSDVWRAVKAYERRTGGTGR